MVCRFLWVQVLVRFVSLGFLDCLVACHFVCAFPRLTHCLVAVRLSFSAAFRWGVEGFFLGELFFICWGGCSYVSLTLVYFWGFILASMGNVVVG